MSTRPTRIIRSSLIKKGFIHAEGGDHQRFWFHANHKKTSICTRYSHGVKECNDDLLNKMAKQLKLSRQQFDDLIDCQLGEEGYTKILREKGDLKG